MPSRTANNNSSVSISFSYEIKIPQGAKYENASSSMGVNFSRASKAFTILKPTEITNLEIKKMPTETLYLNVLDKLYIDWKSLEEVEKNMYAVAFGRNNAIKTECGAIETEYKGVTYSFKIYKHPTILKISNNDFTECIHSHEGQKLGEISFIMSYWARNERLNAEKILTFTEVAEVVRDYGLQDKEFNHLHFLEMKYNKELKLPGSYPYGAIEDMPPLRECMEVAVIGQNEQNKEDDISDI